MEKIIKLKKTDIPVFVDILSDAYPSMKVNTKDEKKKFIELLETRISKNPSTSMYGYFRDKELLGGMVFYDFKMNFMGKVLDVGGVGMVAVHYLHKKEHVAKSLIKFFIDYYDKKGVSLLSLYPFRPDFYKKMGFGFGAPMYEYTMKPSQFRSFGDKSGIKYLKEGDAKEATAVYENIFKSSHGFFEAPRGWLERILKNEKLRTIGSFSGKKMNGFLCFSFKPEQNESVYATDMLIHAFFYKDRDAFKQISTFINSQSDQIRNVILQTQNEDLYFMTDDPRDNSGVVIPSVYHQTYKAGIGMMYRIADVKRFFMFISSFIDPSETVELSFNIKDTFHAKNNGTFVLSAKNSHPKKVVSVDIDISELSSLLSGSASLSTLYTYGRIEIKKGERYLGDAERMLSFIKRPQCYTAF